VSRGAPPARWDADRHRRGSTLALPLLGLWLGIPLLAGDLSRPRAVVSRTGADSAPGQPGPIVVGLKGLVTAGDTLLYTISWGPGARAATYDVAESVSATNGVWRVAADSNASGKWFPQPGTLPYTTGVSSPTLRTWLTAAPWDSATFTVSVASRNSVGVSAPVTAMWRVLRKPGLPGPIVVDSSLVVVGLRLVPPTLARGQTACVCTYAQFHDGALATQTGSRCVRNPLWKLPTAAQQAHTDSMTFQWSASPVSLLGVQQGRAC